jgi:protease-4
VRPRHSIDALIMPPSLEHDLLVDRRRLKRGLLGWRVAAVLLGATALFLAVGPKLGDGALGVGALGVGGLGGRHLTRLTVEGTISDDRDLTEAIGKAARDPRVAGMILSIDSPGGTVAGGEGLHAALQVFQERKKPIVAVMRGTAASAAYMIAMPAQRIFARESTVTGSIGVILQSFDASVLLDRLGVKAEALTSGPLKGQPSPFKPMDEAGRTALQSVVRDLHGQFVGMVVKGRNLPRAFVEQVADGRVYTGRQALEMQLVDAIGGEAEARAWLAETQDIPLSVPISELKPDNDVGIFGFSLHAVAKSLLSEWLAVDGFKALWQPSR